MLYILLVTLTTLTLVTGVPIHMLESEFNNPMTEVVYVPYDIEYIPMGVPVPSGRASTNKEVNKKKTKPILLDDKTFQGLQHFKTGGAEETEENLKHPSISILKKTPEHMKPYSTEDKSSAFDLFEDKFNIDPSRSSEDFVLVPISVLRKLQDDANVDSSSKTHVVAKRQAPGDGFGYRPVVQFRRVFRDRRRVFRRPALVGYLNDYDDFPTVA